MRADEPDEIIVQPLRLMSRTPLVRVTYREQHQNRTFDITVEKHLRPERYYWNVDELERSGFPNRLWDSGPTGYPDAIAAYRAAQWMIVHETGGPE